MMKKLTLNKMILTATVSAALFSTMSHAYENYEVTEEKINQEIDQELQALSTPVSSKSASNMSQVKKTTTTTTVLTPTPVSSSAGTSSVKSTTTTTQTQMAQSAGMPSTSKTTTKKSSSKQTMKSALSGGAVVEAGASKGVQRQPITFIEATPLSESKAEELRRRRQDEEMRTEARIVEKLEKSRMEDERKRAELLFAEQQQPAVVVQPAAPVELEPLTLEETTTQSTTQIEQDSRPRFFDSSYIGITAGVPAYPQFQDEIIGNYNVGLKFGMGHDRFMFEVGLGMSQFLLENSPYTGTNGLVATNSFAVGLAGNGGPLGSPADFEMKQYTGSVGSRYQLMDGFVRPNVGGELIYSYRQYNSLEQTIETNNLGQTVFLPSGTGYGTSHAVDFGLLAGVDLQVSEQFFIGADLKYLFPIGYRLEGERGTAGTAVEKLQHLVGGLSARFQF